MAPRVTPRVASLRPTAPVRSALLTTLRESGSMITRFEVHGFKSLSSADVELRAFNVFIGANGSGKSNLLEAIGVMGAAVSGSVEPETLTYRGVRPGLPSLYKTSNRSERFRRNITMEANSGECIYKVGLDNPITSPSPSWRIMSETLHDGKTKILTRNPGAFWIWSKAHNVSLAEGAKISATESIVKLAAAMREDAENVSRMIYDLRNYAIFAPNTPVLRGIVPDHVERQPLGLAGGGLAEAVKELLNFGSEQFGDFDLDDIFEMIDWANYVSVVRRSPGLISPAVKTSSQVIRFVDRFMRPERRVLSGYDASEGALYILFILALAAHSESPRFLAIDNFDQALHPRVAARLTSMVSQYVAKSKDRQMLLTTHNPLVLDGLDLRNEEIRLFAVERDKKGLTRVRPITLSEELEKDARKDSLPLSRLWVMGRLGAVPKGI